MLDRTVLLKTSLSGSGGAEVFVGTSGDEAIDAKGGDDILFASGGSGQDDVRGGTGNDLYRFEFASSDEDVLSEVNGGGTDTLSILDASAEALSIRRPSATLIIEKSDAPGRAR